MHLIFAKYLLLYLLSRFNQIKVSRLQNKIEKKDKDSTTRQFKRSKIVRKLSNTYTVKD